ncbi:MAG: cryptochrome/photolyase family protein [Asgard group archaeon]|nr:cryptochrome/photolyase family protein [Asgard group archaeon]
MTEKTVIFPNQLFLKHPAIRNNRIVYLIECNRYFKDFAFHQKKLLFQRATMKAYQKQIEKQDIIIKYINNNQFQSMDNFFKAYILTDDKINIHIIEIIDKKLSKRFEKAAEKFKVEIIYYPTPAFLCSKKWIIEFFHNKKGYFMTDFYKAQRKRMKILLKKGKPIGGKWSFDKENRKKLSASVQIPKYPTFGKNNWVKEGKQYIKEGFPKNPGTTDNFIYPTTIKEVEIWFLDFLENRLNYFGDYEDAISKNHRFLFHSVLSPLLNCGLITPKNVIQKTLDYADENQIQLNSLEGFIRQIIGWREFIRAIYLLEGEKQKTSNYWKFEARLPSSFYDGTTGILPVDKTINKTVENAYCHHIERLMILGNFLLLTRVSPREVYNWFMELFIDAYDWVMVPNVFGMSQFADGGLMATKPYISSSNYILKMSDYPKKGWGKIFDALYWSFLIDFREKLTTNPRMNLMYSILDKKKIEDKKEYQKISREFLKRFHESAEIE